MFKNIVILLVLIYSSFILGCERPCRDAIASSFTDKYTPLIHHVINKLQDPLVNIIQQTQIPDQLSSAMPVDTIHDMLTKNVLNHLQQFQDNITSVLETNIYSVMFQEKDPFKGDCNHPKRLSRTKPPPGDVWTLQECKYIYIYIIYLYIYLLIIYFI